MLDQSILHDSTAQYETDIRFNKGEPVGVCDEINFCEGNQTGAHLENIEYGEVLAGLRHDTFVSRDHQDGSIDAADAGEHIFNKITVTRNINDADLPGFRQGKPAETKVDRHLAFLLLLETIGVGTSESSHEGGFSMVHMTGCTDYAHVTSKV